MENCEKCNVPNICLKCENNTYFILEEKDKCYIIDLKKYYTKNNGISYIPCGNGVTNCDECYKEDYCVKCIDDYGLVIGNTKECKSTSELNIDHFKYNDTHYQKCDSVINY